LFAGFLLVKRHFINELIFIEVRIVLREILDFAMMSFSMCRSDSEVPLAGKAAISNEG